MWRRALDERRVALLRREVQEREARAPGDGAPAALLDPVDDAAVEGRELHLPAALSRRRGAQVMQAH